MYVLLSPGATKILGVDADANELSAEVFEALPDLPHDTWVKGRVGPCVGSRVPPDGFVPCLRLFDEPAFFSEQS